MQSVKIKILIAILLIGCSSVGQAVYSSPIEHKVKSAYLYNFLRFIEWPKNKLSKDDVIQLCVLGQAPFSEYLNSLEQRQVRGHGIQINYSSNISEINSCHLLYIDKDEKEAIKLLLTSHIPATVVTVSDADEFTTRGGMIEFFKVDQKIRFSININTVNNSEVKINSRLLELAKIVRP